MPNLSASLQLTPQTLSVLQDCGILTLGQLAGSSVSDLQWHFVQAAREGRFDERPPSLVKVATWVEKAGDLAQSAEGAPEIPLIAVPLAVVKRSAEAERTPGKRAYSGSGSQLPSHSMVQLRPNRHGKKRDPEADTAGASSAGGHLNPTPRTARDDVEPVATELNPETNRILSRRRRSPDLRTPASKAPSPPEPAPPAPAANTRGHADVEADARPEKAPFRTFDDYKKGRINVHPLDRRSLAVGEDLERDTGSEQSSFEEEQVAKRRMPRWKVRGVRYPDPGKALFGAFVTLMTIGLTVLTALACILFPFYFEDRRFEIAILAGANIAFALCYLFSAIGIRCRTCTCHLFYSRRCLKNGRAHRLFGMFPLIAQSLHMLLFRWFRCMYCGTAIRLKDEQG